MSHGTSKWRDSLIGLGLVIGAGVGTALGLILAGRDGIALGATMGAGVGIVLGAIARNLAGGRE